MTDDDKLLLRAARLATALGKDAKKVMNTDDLLEQIIGYFGGQEAFAAVVVKEFQAANAGSMVRQRIIELISRLMKDNEPDTRPLDEIDTKELEDVLKGLVHGTPDNNVRNPSIQEPSQAQADLHGQ